MWGCCIYWFPQSWTAHLTGNLSSYCLFALCSMSALRFYRYGGTNTDSNQISVSPASIHSQNQKLCTICAYSEDRRVAKNVPLLAFLIIIKKCSIIKGYLFLKLCHSKLLTLISMNYKTNCFLVCCEHSSASSCSSTFKVQNVLKFLHPRQHCRLCVLLCVISVPGSIRGSGRVMRMRWHSAACIIACTLSSVADHTLCCWDALWDVLRYTHIKSDTQTHFHMSIQGKY